MSAIDPTVPVDTEPRFQGAARMREHRQWLKDFAVAFQARHQATGLDPSSWTGEFKVPTAAPGTPKAGDFFITDNGQLNVYDSGVALHPAGDLELATKTAFLQTTTPVGWTRLTTGPTGGGLRYRASGTPTSATASDVSGTFAHSGGLIQAAGIGGGGSSYYTTLPGTHAAFLYHDVLEASRS
jgi:hypothetical protein